MDKNDADRVALASLTLEKPLPPQPDAEVSDYGASPALCLTLLGSMQARDANGNDVLPRFRKSCAVLAILALAAPGPVLRSHLINLLWSKRDTDQGRSSLRQAVLRLREALGPAARLLQVERSQMRLSNTGLRVDVLPAVSTGPAPPDRLAQWQGLLLPDLFGLDPAFDRWLRRQQLDLAQRARGAAEVTLAEASEPAATAAAARHLLTIDNAHEGAWRALIGAHAARGDRAAALSAFEQCRAALVEQYRVAPSPETTALVDDLRATIALSHDALPVHASVLIAPGRHRPRIRLRLGVAPLRGDAAAGTAELAAALTEELIVTLSRFRWLGCVPCASGQRHHDTDFLLDGKVQRSADRLRVSVCLTDVRSGAQVVWAERFDRDVTDIFALRNWFASVTVAQIELRLWLWDHQRCGASDATPRTPQDMVRLAVPALYRLDRERFMTAGRWLHRSVELDPDDPSAHAWSVQWYLHCVGQGWAADAAAGTRRAQDLAEHAIRLDPDDARGLTLAGHARAFLHHRPDEALRLHERAMLANPSLPLSWCLSGLALSYVGDCAEGIRRIRHAQALLPGDAFDFFNEMALCVSNLLRGEYEVAAAAGRRAITLNPRFSSSHKAYLAAMGHLGCDDTTAASRAALAELEPNFSVAQAISRSPFATAEGRMLYAEGLRAAGLR